MLVSILRLTRHHRQRHDGIELKYAGPQIHLRDLAQMDLRASMTKVILRASNEPEGAPGMVRARTALPIGAASFFGFRHPITRG